MESWFILTGNIDANVIHQTISWFSQEVHRGTKKVKFYISSTGGDMDSAYRLFDFLKSLPIELETIGFGQVDSAAIILFLTGTNRIATKNCRFLLHEGTFHIGLPSASLHAHEESLKLFKDLKDKNISIIARETGNKVTLVSNKIAQSTIFNAEEAKKFGLVNEIVEKFEITQLNAQQPQTNVV